MHRSVWVETFPPLERRPLEGDLSVDVCIVGAGIAGMTTACLLAQAGLGVAVIDDGPVGGGATQATSAHLSYWIDDFYAELEKIHGDNGIRIAAQSHRAAIDRIETLAVSEGIACDFARVDAWLFLAPEDRPEKLARELAAAHRAGLHDVTADLHPRWGDALHFPRAAEFHPLRYLAGLADAIERRGGRIFTGSHAEPSAAGLRVGPHTVRAASIVFATNSPVNDRVTMHTKQAPYMTYVIALRIPKGVPPMLAWDTGDPYHYVRTAPYGGGEVLIVGGEDHKTGQARDQDLRYARLERWARERFPEAGELVHRWGGQVMEPVDYLAFSGRNPGDVNVYIHTGDSGMGLTHGTIGAMIISDQILGNANPWAWLYDPARKPIGAARELATENLNVLRQYASHLGGGEVRALSDIAPGQGALMRRGMGKVAVYRDLDGSITERSATCPHLGCVVQWNGTERTWDCPCHGSRFTAKGDVIYGPANSDLAPAEERRQHPRAA